MIKAVYDDARLSVHDIPAESVVALITERINELKARGWHSIRVMTDDDCYDGEGYLLSFKGMREETPEEESARLFHVETQAARKAKQDATFKKMRFEEYTRLKAEFE